jgi:transposase
MKSYVGIDWSERQHDVRVQNEAGASVARFRVPHSLAGFQTLAARLRQINPEPANCLVGLETQDNLLVDYLGEEGFTLYVLPPNSVAHNRRRYQSSAAKDDDRDAFVMADVLRTDQGRLRPWRPDSVLVRQLRVHLSGLDDLTGDIVREQNRLRATLLRYYPQALAAFPNLQLGLALHFLEAFPSPAAVAQLSYEAFVAFSKAHGYYHYRHLPGKYAQFLTEVPQGDPALANAYQLRTRDLAQQLRLLCSQKKTRLQQIQALFEQHEDAALFASLPGAGELLAPKLLVMFGDQRTRYPQPMFLPAIAGTAPVTRQSGKAQRVTFRRACNRSYRQTAQQFARCSCTKSVWAAGYLQRCLTRGKSYSHAYRCLANRWLHIIWTLWQRREVYDEEHHLRDVHQQRRPSPTTV